MPCEWHKSRLGPHSEETHQQSQHSLRSLRTPGSPPAPSPYSLNIPLYPTMKPNTTDKPFSNSSAKATWSFKVPIPTLINRFPELHDLKASLLEKSLPLPLCPFHAAAKSHHRHLQLCLKLRFPLLQHDHFVILRHYSSVPTLHGYRSEVPAIEEAVDAYPAYSVHDVTGYAAWALTGSPAS
ncbi:hypothetical protein BDW72DRAFT_199363 [Aspergillus terricola var. indicus]